MLKRLLIILCLSPVCLSPVACTTVPDATSSTVAAPARPPTSNVMGTPPAGWSEEQPWGVRYAQYTLQAAEGDARTPISPSFTSKRRSSV